MAGLKKTGLHRQLRSECLFFALALQCAGVGCDSTELDPFRNDGRLFSVYGYINDLEFDHALRVIPITRHPERIGTTYDRQAQIDAFVTTTDTLTGEVVHWRHALEQLSDGSFGHIYRAAFNVMAGHTYHLDITRNDGRSVTAETTVPFLANTHAEPQLAAMAADTRVYQDIFLPGIHSLWHMNVVYFFPFEAPSRIAYDRVGHAVEGEGWRFTIDFQRDMERLAAMRNTSVEELSWAAMGVEVQVLDRNWDPPLDIFDPEVLAQPGTLSNIENGYGFFGSIGLLQNGWSNGARLDSLLGFSKRSSLSGTRAVFHAFGSPE